ncbi:MAG: hypothetical protein CL872_01065 [Dehalococcoidaceae bacterium]|nr:hypothetical protein [Dehalococcoidaceae bacterium]
MNNKIISEALSIALGIGIIAITFGLISKEAGLSLWQTQSLSLFALTGASQFTFVLLFPAQGILAALIAALLVGARNAVYAFTLNNRFQVNKTMLPFFAYLSIDETTAVSMPIKDTRIALRSFWWTGILLAAFWNIGTFVGYLAGEMLPSITSMGLDAGMGLLFLILVMRQIDSRMDSIRILFSLLTAIILGVVFGFNYALIGTALVAILPIHLFIKQGNSS